MKSYILGLSLLTLTLGSYASAQDVNQSTLVSNNLGDVVYSILPPELFELNHSGKWSLLNGNELQNSTGLYRFLEKHGRTDLLKDTEGSAQGTLNLPDARGVFIRGANLNRPPAEGDPSGDSRNIGSYQSDQAGKHSHKIEIPGAGHRAGKHKGNKSFQAPFREDSGGNKLSAFPSNTAGGNPEDAADTESRPKNITLYTYIKIGS